MSFRKPKKTGVSFGKLKSNTGNKETSQPFIETIFLECPICNEKVTRVMIESHVETCLAATSKSNVVDHTPSLNEHEEKNSIAVSPSPIIAVTPLSLTQLTPTKLIPTNAIQPIAFPNQRSNRMERKPLSERMRPHLFSELKGNTELLGEQAMVRRLLERDPPPSMILFGPPGCGKTTLASIVSRQTKCPYRSLSCCTAGVQDIREIATQALVDLKQKGLPTILFMDEIHRFNKRQQDIFLPFVEQGTLVLIGATTENPSFSIISSLLSRCQVIPLNTLSVSDLVHILQRALLSDSYLLNSGVLFHDDELIDISMKADGDARMALNMLDACAACASSLPTKQITKDIINSTFSQRYVRYDKHGEEHYNLASALQKSIRGSDVQAAVYWLARMIEGGEDPIYIARRLLVIASEDIGLADPQAISIASACFQACKDIGVPECNLALTECAAYLALTAKSNEMTLAYSRARDLVHTGLNPPVPLHIRNAPIESMEDLGYGLGYQYGYNKNQTYLPKDLLEREFVDVSRAVTDLRSISVNAYVKEIQIDNKRVKVKKQSD